MERLAMANVSLNVIEPGALRGFILVELRITV
jgi:hypothetical protein